MKFSILELRVLAEGFGTFGVWGCSLKGLGVGSLEL